MIKTMMIGCVGQNAELKKISGNAYVCFDLAHTDKVKGEKRTTWVRVRKIDNGQNLAQYITKGKALYVEGHPVAGAYLNREGKPTADFTIWADRIEFIAGAGAYAEGQMQEVVQKQQVQPSQQASGPMPNRAAQFKVAEPCNAAPSFAKTTATVQQSAQVMPVEEAEYRGDDLPF